MSPRAACGPRAAGWTALNYSNAVCVFAVTTLGMTQFYTTLVHLYNTGHLQGTVHPI